MTKILKPVDISHQIYYEITPERQAILNLIAYTEGTDRTLDNVSSGYDILYSFKRFKPGKDHPRIGITANGITSTAAGRYQILDFTWDYIQGNLKKRGFKPFPSFDPIYQDQACLYLIDAKRSAMRDVDNRLIDSFLRKCSQEWASLPYSPYGQPRINLDTCVKVYNQFLKLAES